MITSKTPATWQDLQAEVGRLLQECGFHVEIEKKIETKRGIVEVDVYAEESIKGRTYVTLCECKHWKSNVSRNVVDGFRSTMGDFGANTGYIVSISKFQPAAYAAAENTNVRPVTWQELQLHFEPSWLETHLVPTVTDRLDPLLFYTEPLLPRWFDQLSEDNKNAYIGLKKKYDVLGPIVMRFTKYHRVLNFDIPVLPLLPQLAFASAFLSNIPKEILEEAHYREFLDALLDFGEGIVKQFRTLRDSLPNPPGGDG